MLWKVLHFKLANVILAALSRMFHTETTSSRNSLDPSPLRWILVLVHARFDVKGPKNRAA